MEKYEGRFSEGLIKALGHSELTARDMNHEYQGTEHLLLGILREGGDGSRIIAKHFTISDVRRVDILLRPHIYILVKKGSEKEYEKNNVLHLTPRAKKALDYTMEEADADNVHKVGIDYLLLGLLREQDGVAAQVLMNLDFRLEDLRSSIREERYLALIR